MNDYTSVVEKWKENFEEPMNEERVAQHRVKKMNALEQEVLLMDRLTDEVRQGSMWIIMFADYIVIYSTKQVEEHLERWRFALERKGMKVIISSFYPTLFNFGNRSSADNAIFPRDE